MVDTPMSEWTRADLEDRMFAETHLDLSRACLAELLRRERERCADPCRDWAADMRATWDFLTNTWAHSEAGGAAEMEHRIRKLS